MPNEPRLRLGIFASDQGPGDAERSTLMTSVGSFLARKGAKLICLAEEGAIPTPLISSAHSAGGDVTLVAGPEFADLPGLTGMPVERLPTPEERFSRVAALSDIYVALPGSLMSAASLYFTWTRGGGGPGRKPVVFFDRHGAFKVIRGYASDVISNSISHHDRYVQFADSPDDMWTKITWLVAQGATNVTKPG